MYDTCITLSPSGLTTCFIIYNLSFLLEVTDWKQDAVIVYRVVDVAEEAEQLIY